jgi:2-keto-4-pentenoate hydratase
VQQLSAIGHRLRAGDIVLTGGITRAAPLRPGTIITARFNPGDLELSIRKD